MLKIVPVIYIEQSCDEDEFEDERPAISEVCFEESDDPAPPFAGVAAILESDSSG